MLPLRPLFLLLAWLLLNLLQAALTPLDPDETYYWMYAGQLDWGYFDHPPAVALLIALGRDWLPGSLGLRLGHVLCSSGLLVAMYFLLNRPAGRWLVLATSLLLAQPMLQVYGFIATPDGPLLLATALYLLAYRRFLRQPTVAVGCVWGLTMALLLYSKYHGVVLIFFSVLPQLAYLLRQPGAWVAAGSGLLLFLPHLYWQYSNDYPSFRYHLSGRDDPYQLKYTLQYLGNQLLIFSPFLLYYYVRTFTHDRAHDRFERACRWLVAGVLLFFLYTTTKGGTEAQWTALLSIPLVYLTYRALRRYPAWAPGLRRMAYLTIGLLLVARLLLLLPREWLPFEKPFDHAPWVRQLAERVGDRPVMIENSYRLASLYSFYSGGQPAWTFTDVEYRPSQYDLWQQDTIWQGQSVYVLGQVNWTAAGSSPFRTQKRDMRLKRVENFQVPKGTELAVTSPLPERASPGKDIPLRLEATAPRNLYLRGPLPLDLYAILQYPDGRQAFWRLQPLEDSLLSAGTAEVYRGKLHLPEDLSPGVVELSFGLGYRGMPPLRGQSSTYPLRISGE